MKKSLKTLLGFTPLESTIWNHLKEPVSISTLSRETKIPRTTLYTSLGSLESRGLIKIEKDGRESIITALQATDIQKIMSRESALLSPDGEHNIEINENTGFRIIHGLHNMIDIFDYIADKYSKERILAIQPTKSLLTLLRKSKDGYFVPVNEKIKKNKVIFETVTQEGTIPSYLNLYKNKPEIQKNILKSFIGRSADAVFIKNEFLDINSDLLITSKSAFILNWETESGIEIKNKEMINLLKELFKLARGYGRKVDLTNYMRNILDSLK